MHMKMKEFINLTVWRKFHANWLINKLVIEDWKFRNAKLGTKSVGLWRHSLSVDVDFFPIMSKKKKKEQILYNNPSVFFKMAASIGSHIGSIKS